MKIILYLINLIVIFPLLLIMAICLPEIFIPEDITDLLIALIPHLIYMSTALLLSTKMKLIIFNLSNIFIGSSYSILSFFTAGEALRQNTDATFFSNFTELKFLITAFISAIIVIINTLNILLFCIKSSKQIVERLQNKNKSAFD